MKLLWKYKNKNLHKISETLIELILEESSEIKMRYISLSKNTIQRRISGMSMDVMEQILSEIKVSPVFSFQLDESTWYSFMFPIILFCETRSLRRHWRRVSVPCNATRGQKVLPELELAERYAKFLLTLFVSKLVVMDEEPSTEYNTFT